MLAAEWAKLEALGVNLCGGQDLGRELDPDALSATCDAVIVATGCPAPKQLGIDGEDADGVIHALDLFARCAGNRAQIGQNVVVIGGGRRGPRFGPDGPSPGRRTGPDGQSGKPRYSAGQPPRHSNWPNPKAWNWTVRGGRSGFCPKTAEVSEVELQRCLAVFDALGRFAPRFDECSLQTVEPIRSSSPSVKIGNPALADRPQLRSADPADGDEAVFWAGDVVGGPSTIVEAMASGRRAAESVHRLFSGQHLTYGRAYPGPMKPNSRSTHPADRRTNA